MTGFSQCLHFRLHVRFVTIQKATYIDHHVNFLRAVGQSCPRFLQFDLCGVRAEGEAHYTANLDRAARQLAGNQSHIARVHTHRGKPVLFCLLAHPNELRPGSRRFQQRMVNIICRVHLNSPSGFGIISV